MASRFWSGHRLLAGPVLALVGTIADIGRVSKSASLLHANGLARLLGQELNAAAPLARSAASTSAILIAT